MVLQHVFQYMDNYINGRSKIRMIMIWGNDIASAPWIDFLSGLNIIPKALFSHFAFKVVIELRKYGQDLYYNDVLKYNNT